MTLSHLVPVAPIFHGKMAKVALHLASRLMGQYNVWNAEVLVHEPLLLRGNMLDKVLYQFNAWAAISQNCESSELCRHSLSHYETPFRLQILFNYHYSSLKSIFLWHVGNTVAAAMLFEMVYNAEWARPYKGVGSENSYSLGVSDELNRMVVKEKAAEEV